MSEIVNCEYSKTIMEEPVCNAFDVNRYGEIICSEENCIILKLKEQLQAKEQECEQLKAALQASDITKTVISSADINFPIIEKLSNALDEIERIANSWYYNAWFCLNCRINMDKKLKKILDIINKAKDSERKP